MVIDRYGRATIYKSRLGIRIVMLGSLLRARLHLICIPLLLSIGRRIPVRAAFEVLEVGELLHPCGERTATAMFIGTVFHICQFGIARRSGRNGRGGECRFGREEAEERM